MKKLLSTTALIAAMSISSIALAHPAPPPPPKPDHTYIDQAIAKFPPADAAEFRDTLKQAHEKNMALYEQVHALHDEMDDILSAETFDEDAFRADSKQLRDLYETMRTNTDDAFASAVADLSQSERKKLAAAMAYPHKKHAHLDEPQAQ